MRKDMGEPMRCLVRDEALNEPGCPVKEPEPMGKSRDSAALKEMGWAVAMGLCAPVEEEGCSCEGS